MHAAVMLLGASILFGGSMIGGLRLHYFWSATHRSSPCPPLRATGWCSRDL